MTFGERISLSIYKRPRMPHFSSVEVGAEDMIRSYRRVLAGEYPLYRWVAVNDESEVLDIPYKYSPTDPARYLSAELSEFSQLTGSELRYEGEVTMEQALGEIMLCRMVLDNDDYRQRREVWEEILRYRPNNVEDIAVSAEFL